MSLAKIALWLSAANWIAAGSFALALPAANASLIQLEVDSKLSSSDLRAVYGGLCLVAVPLLLLLGRPARAAGLAAGSLVIESRDPRGSSATSQNAPRRWPPRRSATRAWFPK